MKINILYRFKIYIHLVVDDKKKRLLKLMYKSIETFGNEIKKCPF